MSIAHRLFVMIYFFENYDGFSCEKYLDFLDDNRREKYERLKQNRDKENCVISYILLKKALALCRSMQYY